MRYTNEQINWNLTGLRNDLRDGNVKILGPDYANTFRLAIARQIDPNVLDIGYFFTDAKFNPQTVKRFSKLFDVPTGPLIDPYYPAGEKGVKGPTQDDFAWAIQNFINRRAEPWAFLSPKPEPDANFATSGQF